MRRQHRVATRPRGQIADDRRLDVHRGHGQMIARLRSLLWSQLIRLPNATAHQRRIRIHLRRLVHAMLGRPFVF